jgi:ABC-type polysaccharide/polyol phosphate transport system ATPase subunit
VIEAKNLSKKYIVYKNGLSRLRDWVVPATTAGKQEFWALRDVSFEIGSGECLGIIGSNGAGKSTLLRLLTGISKPTSGDLNVEGRIASLLELGVGFHLGLPGRENILLGARFLGLTMNEIEARVNEMIEFAELGQFIDQPMRTYSAGMFVRLGFAAVLAIDPEVLIIDEVLSVGDAYFQRKSLNRIEYFKDNGKTLVIVSHSMPIIQRFSDKTLWLHEGSVRLAGETRRVVKEYELFSREKDTMYLGSENRADHPSDAVPHMEKNSEDFRPLGSRWGTGEIRITRVEMVGKDPRSRWHFVTGETVTVRLHCDTKRPVDNPIFGLLVHAIDGTLLFATANYNIDPHDFGTIDDECCIEYTFDHLNLNKGTYFLSAAAFLEPDHPFWDRPADFHNQMYEFKMWSDKIEHGCIHMVGRWDIGDKRQ